MIVLISLLASGFSLLIALFVFTQNTKRRLNQGLFLFIFFANLWILSVYMLNNFPAHNLIMFRVSFLFAVLMVTSMLYFIVLITKSSFSKLFWAGLSIGAIVAGVLSFTPWVIREVEMATDQFNNLHISPVRDVGYIVVILFILFCALYALWLLARSYLQARGLLKVQLQFVAISFGIATASALTTNVILPNLTGNTDYTVYAPLSVLLLSVGLSYAIIKHRLLDIRLIVARSVAYLLSIGIIAGVFGFIAFGFIDVFFPETRMGSLQQAIYTVAAVFLAFAFQPVKRFFNTFTDRIFYRGRYETESVLNELGKVLVAQSNSFELLDDSLAIITGALKTQNGLIVVIDENDVYKTASVGDVSDVNIAMDALQKFEVQLSIYDETQKGEELYEAFHQLGAHAVLRLMVQDELVGYLLLGSKQTGTIFTQQDVNLLEILAQELAVAIQNVKSYQQIANFSQTLQREVEDATTQLRESNQRLRELDKAKDEFISMASHQLRTPLTTIKGYLSMLLEGDAGKLSKKQKEFVDLAFVGSQRMVYLISDMLNVSRISTGKLTIDKKPFDIADVVKSEVEQLQQQANARQTQLTFHPPPEDTIQVTLDEGKIRQVVMNFIDNAVYYAPKGNVDVYVEKTKAGVEFRVVDDGIGVPEDAQKQLFTKFYRAENARDLRPDGTGLGLYMAKQVIEAQSGEIIFESEEGKGSTFGFRFSLEDQDTKEPSDTES